jgi:hypothetical protein
MKSNRCLICGFLIVLAVAEWWLFASTSTKSATPGSDFAILYAGAKLANENPPALRYFALIQEITNLLRLAIHPLGLFISAYGLLRSLGSETLATTGSLVLGIFLGVWLFVRWPSDYNLGRFSSWFARLILATLLTMSYSLIYDLLLIIPVIAFTFGVRGAQASALAFLYCAPILYFFLGSGAINLSPIALGWLFVAIDRSCPESYGTVVDLKTENISSS